jgi:hypothetical protein
MTDGGCEDGLRPTPTGRPKSDPRSPVKRESELERLCQENERLRAELAYRGQAGRITPNLQLATTLHEHVHWHDTERTFTKLKGLGPVQYRTQALAA